MQDTIVETTPTQYASLGARTCRHCQASFEITAGDVEFYKKVSPRFGDYVAEIPTPTLCPECRMRRRLSFRNERKLYRRICDATKQPIISIYAPSPSDDKGGTVGRGLG